MAGWGVGLENVREGWSRESWDRVGEDVSVGVGRKVRGQTGEDRRETECER